MSSTNLDVVLMNLTLLVAELADSWLDLSTPDKKRLGLGFRSHRLC